jgi:FAD/FMN-containing dehydrogenase
MAVVAVSSWGRLGAWPHEVETLQRHVHNLPLQKNKSGLAYGMGRSYGDVCLNPEGVLWRTISLDRFIHFDAQTGELHCEAGVLLRDIQRTFAARGWMLPVTPGTQFVTVGGAVANDVHGKNHHAEGCFGDHVLQFTLQRTDGTVIECTPTQHPEWFAATIGGLGLTGVITQARLQLKRIQSTWLDVETIPYTSLDEFFTLSDSSEQEWEYTVSWIDCVSRAERGIFMRANMSATNASVPEQRQARSVPFAPPVSLINTITLKPFNAGYFHLKKMQAGHSVQHMMPFFYPLDNLLHWNRIYGPRGFFQYQSVVPRAVGHDAVQAMLKEIAKAGEGSFLAVLKTFGNRESCGMLSFAQPGVTLALDFPNKGEASLQLFTRLDAIVREAGGRIYAAKDARMPQDLFESGYPRLQEFLSYRDPGISSALSRRLMGA